jgi:signal transduction histidine kinase
MERRRFWHALQDALLAAALAALGVAELWVPFASVYGEGSPVVSTLGVLASAALLTQRRSHPALSIGVFVVWLVIGVLTLGQVHALFFGQVVPFMVALYSLARHGRGRLPVLGAAVGALTLLFADLTLPQLQDVDEIVFHWTVCAVAFAVGWGLRSSEERAVAAAVRANEAAAESRERARIAVAEERARIARELHDVLAHSVSLMVVQAGAAEQVVDDDAEYVRRALETIRTTGTESLDEVRRVVSILRESGEEAGLEPQPGMGELPRLVESSRSQGLDVGLAIDGDPTQVPPGLGLAAFRIVQESLTNIRKHSDATFAEVAVRVAPERLEVEVRDDGPRRREPGGAGHGLIGMRERAAVYGGALEAGPSGTGFSVRAVIPRAEA